MKRIKQVILTLSKQPDILITLITLLIVTIILILELVEGITSRLQFGILLALDLFGVSNLIMLMGRLTPIEFLADESNKAIQEVIRTIGFPIVALRSGIVNIYAKRMDDKRAEKAIKEHINATRKELLMEAIALPEFFETGPYTSLIAQKLANEVDIRFRVLLLNPNSKAANERAFIEEGRGTIGDIKESIEAIQRYMEDNRNIVAYLYNFHPMLFLLSNEKMLLVELYHFGKPPSLPRGQPIGGRVPLLAIERTLESSYETMLSHFNYVWQRKDRMPVHSRVIITDYSPDGKYVQVENKAEFTEVLMSGWVIDTGNEQSIPIPEVSVQPQSKMAIHGLNLGDTKPSVLRLRNMRGIVVAESKYVDDKYIPQGYII